MVRFAPAGRSVAPGECASLIATGEDRQLLLGGQASFCRQCHRFRLLAHEVEEDRTVQPFQNRGVDRERRFYPGHGFAGLVRHVFSLGCDDQRVGRSGFDAIHLDAADHAGEALVDATAHTRLFSGHGHQSAVLFHTGSLRDLSILADLRRSEVEGGVETVRAVAA